MKVQKIDRRFKMYKAGLATHMVEMNVADFNTARQLLTTAYGPGQYVPRWKKTWHIKGQNDWYYDTMYYKRPMVHGTRCYFRRKEQATYLALAMS